MDVSDLLDSLNDAQREDVCAPPGNLLILAGAGSGKTRVYSSTDLVGVELGGALKNIIAIAAGSADGAGFGDNTKAALMARGLVEMSRLGVAMGAQMTTFSGLSGIGDLIVTCMSRHSRNRYV